MNKTNEKIIDIFLQREALFSNIFWKIVTPKIIYNDEVERAKKILNIVFEYPNEELEILFPSQIDEKRFHKTLNTIFNFSAWEGILPGKKNKHE